MLLSPRSLAPIIAKFNAMEIEPEAKRSKTMGRKIKHFVRGSKIAKDILAAKEDIRDAMRKFTVYPYIISVPITGSDSSSCSAFWECLRRAHCQGYHRAALVPLLTMQSCCSYNSLVVNTLAMRVTLEKLTRARARYDAAETPSECMPGTRVELLKDLTSRATGGINPAVRVVALCGIAGIRKIDHCKIHRNRPCQAEVARRLILLLPKSRRAEGDHRCL